MWRPCQAWMAGRRCLTHNRKGTVRGRVRPANILRKGIRKTLLFPWFYSSHLAKVQNSFRASSGRGSQTCHKTPQGEMQSWIILWELSDVLLLLTVILYKSSSTLRKHSDANMTLYYDTVRSLIVLSIFCMPLFCVPCAEATRLLVWTETYLTRQLHFMEFYGM